MLERLKKQVGDLVNRLSKTNLVGKDVDEALKELELVLLQNDVALSVATNICENLKEELSRKSAGLLENKKDIVKNALREVLLRILTVEEPPNIVQLATSKRSIGEPVVIAFVGIHGTGKTTTITKVARLLLDNGFSIVLACSDTHRAGSIEQLEEHAKNLRVPMVKHKYGSDPAAVAYDAIQHARARRINVVLIDTAGRMETNRNLMESMRKIVRVASPDLVIFVGDALTGNDAVAQASEFNKYVPISGAVLTKMDADAKGGAAISIVSVTKKPILYMGSGQRYEDLVPFVPERLVDNILP